MFYTTGWKAELPLSEIPKGSPAKSHTELYYPSQQHIEQHPPPLQPWHIDGPYQQTNNPTYAATVDPAQVYVSRAPADVIINNSMSSMNPLLSDKEAQGTLESPFTSKVLRREYDLEDSASDLLDPPDLLAFPLDHHPPTAAQVNESNSKPLDELKPVLSLPLRSQPPRPQNAWILYRSDRLRAIAAGEPIPGLLAVLEEQSLVRAPDVSEHRVQKGKNSPSSPEGSRFQLFKDAELSTSSATSETPEDITEDISTKYRRALLQADISKVIGMMWKRESKEVKSKYEGMAEAKKLEHQQKYPNYKYQPIRKEERLKQQEQIKAERERIKKEAVAAKAHLRKMAKTTRQVKVSREKSPPLASRSASEKRSRRTRRFVSQASHVLTIPLSPSRSSDRDHNGTPVAQTVWIEDDVKPQAEILEPFRKDSPIREIKQEPMEQPYVASAMNYPQYTQSLTEYTGSMVPTYYPVGEHQVYHLHPGGYVPVPQPGFMVQQNQVIPYTFEAMPMELPYLSRAGERAIKQQPAIAVMEPSGYQPIGVSEAELAEMWSMLEDDGGSNAVQSDFQTHATGTGQNTTILDGDTGIETWGNLPAVVDEQDQASISLDRLSGFVASKIAMNWVDDQGQALQASYSNPLPSTTIRQSQAAVPTHLPLMGGGYQNVPVASPAVKRTRYTARDAPLCSEIPVSPMHGVFTPLYGTFPSVLTPTPRRQSQLEQSHPGVEDHQSSMYYHQMYPSDFVGQPGANPYEYRLVTPRTASFQDAQFPPLSLSAPS